MAIYATWTQELHPLTKLAFIRYDRFQVILRILERQTK